MPRDALHLVVLGQALPPQFPKEPGPCPLLKLVMERRRAQAAELFSGQGIPDGSGAQDIHHGGKVGSIGIPGLSSGTRTAFVCFVRSP